MIWKYHHSHRTMRYLCHYQDLNINPLQCLWYISNNSIPENLVLNQKQPTVDCFLCPSYLPALRCADNIKRNSLLVITTNPPQFVCFLNRYLPFNSLRWLKCTFFQKYPYIIQQTGKENTLTYQVEVVILI